MNMTERAMAAKKASYTLAALDGDVKNKALLAIADALLANAEAIVAANETDLARSREEQLAAPLLKSLFFDRTKLEDTVDGVRSTVAVPDPVGQILMATEMDTGLELFRISCPIGVMGIIFESRPDALVQISTLCLKSGNAVLLKGGREAISTNRILFETIRDASLAAGLPDGWIHLMEGRDEVNAMLALDDYVDLIIPRGSNEFVRYIMDHSRIPVMGHADGICHAYVDASANLDMAVPLVFDSKTQYVAVCNALETLLVHADVAEAFLPMLKRALDEKDVALYGDARAQAIIPCNPASEQDWKTEYLDYVLSIRVVDSLDEAIDHINTYGSGHTDMIVSEDATAVERFMQHVDSGNVFSNCSTRFSDGFKYGFGAEVGISTNKLHARGPVGLEGLVTYKYKLFGHGQVAADYAEKRKQFTHRSILEKSEQMEMYLAVQLAKARNKLVPLDLSEFD